MLALARSEARRWIPRGLDFVIEARDDDLTRVVRGGRVTFEEALLLAPDGDEDIGLGSRCHRESKHSSGQHRSNSSKRHG
jgi:hypothetical protein